MSHLTLIDAQHSEVESYLQKVIRSGIENSVTSTNAKNEQMNNVENGNVETRSPRKEVSSHLFMVFISQHYREIRYCYIKMASLITFFFNLFKIIQQNLTYSYPTRQAYLWKYETFE